MCNNCTLETSGAAAICLKMLLLSVPPLHAAVGLAVQLLIWPDSVKDDEPRPDRPQGPALPKVTVTSSPDEIKRAFDSLSSNDD
jgi:hypothetical protein